MATLKILTFPDPRLREVSLPVKKFTPELKTLAKDMLETMYAAPGIGLAAPQVGELIRMLVIDTRPRDEKGHRHSDDMTELEKAVTQPLILVNPEIINSKGKTTYDEGCLSVPTYFETVERSEYVEVKAQDLDGNEIIIKTDGLLGICIQHEMDHLEGTLFIDHLSFIKNNKIKNQIKKYGYPDPLKEKDLDVKEKQGRQKL